MTSQAVTVLSCRGASPGKATGPAVVSSDAICFYLVDPPTGKVIEGGHAIEGRPIGGTVLVCPGGKGSSVVQADGLFQLSKAGTAPAAIVVEEFDTVLVATAVIMGVPLVRCAPVEFKQIRDGDVLEVDSGQETVTIK